MISVVIPILNEAATIVSLIEFCRAAPRVNEIIVIDDGSTDESVALAAQAGAKVITSSMLGKGASMEDGVRRASNETILFLDGDLSGLDKNLISRLTQPLFEDQADFVKAKFSRSAGRVTILTARPLLKLFFPELSSFEQPLGGIIAGKKRFLKQLIFENDYGVDIGILIDMVMAGRRVVEVDIGHLDHDSQPLDRLGAMAGQVVRTIMERASRYGRFKIDQVKEVQEIERQMQAELSVVLGSTALIDKLALFDMDGTLLKERYIETLATYSGRTSKLAKYLDNYGLSDEERACKIAEVFEGVPREIFEQAARDIPLAPGAAETVVALRRQGYRVGLVTDSYWIAANIVMRRVFADFSIAHVVHFSRGVSSGKLHLSPLFSHEGGCAQHALCKLNVMSYLCHKYGLSFDQVLAAGDGLNDLCMLKQAGLSFAVNTKNPEIRSAARFTVDGNLKQILELMTGEGETRKLSSF
jgi:HAD superfamily phosphoserine phosphatase-like hydrolase